MKFINVNIQNGWLKRKGFRGKFITIYHHTYDGKQEETERYHFHPWKLAISILYKGEFYDEIRGKLLNYRVCPSISIYTSKTEHRLKDIKKGTRSIFIGLLRRQTIGANATTKYREGYGHYTES